MNSNDISTVNLGGLDHAALSDLAMELFLNHPTAKAMLRTIALPLAVAMKIDVRQWEAVAPGSPQSLPGYQHLSLVRHAGRVVAMFHDPAEAKAYAESRIEEDRRYLKATLPMQTLAEILQTANLLT